MEQSLYFQYVNKYFPQLITSVVEKLNDKRRTTLPYLYKERLTSDFSADGRWASILAEHNRVAADVVALDSELPLKSRDSIQTASGDIPKMGMKLYLTEKQMKDVDNMIAQNLPINQILNKIFNDIPRCIEGIWERIEDMFLSGLSTGVALSTRDEGTGVRIDYGFVDKNKFNASVLWSNPETAKPIEDLQRIFDKALDDQNTITDIWMDDTALNAFYKAKQVREQFAFDNSIVVTTGGTVPTLDFAKVAQVVLTKWNVVLHRVSRSIKTELNGKRVNHKPWKDGMVVCTCDETLGSLVWTNCVEATRPVQNVNYQTADAFILVSKYSVNDPLREFTASQAMVVPIINNVDRIYTLDSKTVEG